ncbi:MAG TPA: hypothetical protein PLU72_09805 [Candidatus Ozemobacteraceae bacterium]|nr:hypothetical protein [Candidatus Ozemobacteraceae bacterium]
MILLVVLIDDPTGIRMTTTLAGQGRRQGVLTLVIAAQPSSVEQGRALPDLENVLRGFEAAADSVILLDRDRLINSDRAGDVSPEEACLRLEQAFLMAVRTCVEPITDPGFIGTDYSDVRAILSGGGLSSIRFGYGHGDCAAEDAVEMALGTSVQRASLLDYTSFLVSISAAHTISLQTINRATSWFQKSVSEDCNIVLASIIDPAFGRGELMFNFIATGKRRTNAEGKTPT